MWEFVTSDHGSRTERMIVAGGVLYRTLLTKYGPTGEDMFSVAIVFVPLNVS